MPPFKDPSFQDRVASASQAKQKALDQLKARPPADKAILASRRREREERERIQDEERAAKAQAKVAARLEKASIEAEGRAAAEAAVALKAARLKPSTPEDMKAARDARYAARKARK